MTTICRSSSTSAADSTACRSRSRSPRHARGRWALRRSSLDWPTASTSSIARGSVATRGIAASPTRFAGRTTCWHPNRPICSNSSACSPAPSRRRALGRSCLTTRRGPSTPTSTSSSTHPWSWSTPAGRRPAIACSTRFVVSRSTNCAAATSWMLRTTGSSTTSSSRCSARSRVRPRAGAPTSSPSSWRASTTSPRRCGGASPTTRPRSVRIGCAPSCGRSSTKAMPTTSPTSHGERSIAGPTTDRSRRHRSRPCARLRSTSRAIRIVRSRSRRRRCQG